VRCYKGTNNQPIFVQDDFLAITISIIIFLNMHSLDHLLFLILLILNLNSFIVMDHVLEVMNLMMLHHPLNLPINHHHHHHQHHHHHYHHHYLHHFIVVLLYVSHSNSIISHDFIPLSISHPFSFILLFLLFGVIFFLFFFFFFFFLSSFL
jgi:hypothetical protein